MQVLISSSSFTPFQLLGVRVRYTQFPSGNFSKQLTFTKIQNKECFSSAFLHSQMCRHDATMIKKTSFTTYSKKSLRDLKLLTLICNVLLSNKVHQQRDTEKLRNFSLLETETSWTKVEIQVEQVLFFMLKSSRFLLSKTDHSRIFCIFTGFSI